MWVSIIEEQVKNNIHALILLGALERCKMEFAQHGSKAPEPRRRKSSAETEACARGNAPGEADAQVTHQSSAAGQLSA
jgi:hypothetical protein